MRFPAFLGPSYISQSVVADNEDTINWYPELVQAPGAEAPIALYPTPGVSRFVTLPTVGGGALWANETRVFAVCGGSFYEINSNGTSTLLGAVAYNTNPATISTNGDAGFELFITSGGKGYLFDLLTNIFSTVLTSGADQGGSLYGYFVAFDKAGATVRMSNLFDGTTWDPTNFFSRSIGADVWQAMHVTPFGFICMLGSLTGEFWYNAGTFPVPFAPDPSGLFSNGIAAPFSVTQVGGLVMFLATNKGGGLTVVAASGFQPDRISDHALERALGTYTRIDDAIGQTYEQDGHVFYLLTFPTMEVTWAFDVTTKRWCKRGTWLSESSRFTYWRPVFHAYGFVRHLVLDSATGGIYTLSNDYPLDVDSRPLRRLRRSPPLGSENLRYAHDYLELLLETGTADQSGQAANPQVMLRYSNDSGRTWSNEVQASAGLVGEYPRRVFWTRLGTGRQRVYEVTVSDPLVNWRLVDVFTRTRPDLQSTAAQGLPQPAKGAA